MAHDHYQAHVQRQDGVFDAGNAYVLDQIAGRANNKQIAYADIKYHFYWNAGIGATHHNCKRGLAGGNFRAAKGGLIGSFRGFVGIAGVAFLQAGEGLIW